MLFLKLVYNERLCRKQMSNSLRRFLSSNKILRHLDENKHSHFFGFQQVTSAEKQAKVKEVFSNVAVKYDLMNDMMSAGIHRLWKDYFINILSPVAGTKLLDVAGGTGDIAFRFLKATSDFENYDLKNSTESDSHVTVLDYNENMLSICKDKASKLGLENRLTCIQGNAEILPFQNDSFDAFTIAFGIRNVVYREKALAEAYRILSPGGRFMCLEFSELRNPALNRLYHWYSTEIIPVMGEIVAGDWKSYQYLIESIQKFPNQERFCGMIKEAGFTQVTYRNLSNGIAAIHSAYKL